MPVPPSRARSRRAFSSAGTSSLSALASSSRGSASSTSRWLPSPSSTLIHSAVTRSSGPSERRNSARDPSPITRAERGAPHPKRSVRALSRGNASIASLTSYALVISFMATTILTNRSPACYGCYGANARDAHRSRMQNAPGDPHPRRRANDAAESPQPPPNAHLRGNFALIPPFFSRNFDLIPHCRVG